VLSKVKSCLYFTKVTRLRVTERRLPYVITVFLKQVNAHRFNATQTGIPEGMEGWVEVDLGGRLYIEMVYLSAVLAHRRSNYLIATQRGVIPTTSRWCKSNVVSVCIANRLMTKTKLSECVCVCVCARVILTRPTDIQYVRKSIGRKHENKSLLLSSGMLYDVQ